jgi:hypothetical protein
MVEADAGSGSSDAALADPHYARLAQAGGNGAGLLSCSSTSGPPGSNELEPRCIA